MHIDCASTEEVRLICETSTDTSQRSLTLLRAVDMTIDALVWIEKQACTTVAFIEKVTTSVKTCNRTSKIDSDHLVTSAVLTSEEASASLYNVLLEKRKCAITAAELDGEDKEAVVEAYNAAVAAVADMHNVFADLRWAIGEHDADLEEPTGKPMSTSQEIAAYLDSL